MSANPCWAEREVGSSVAGDPPLGDNETPVSPRAQRAVEIARHGAVWVARHWLALANGTFLLVLLGAAAVPAMRAAGLAVIADPLFSCYRLVCHQLPDRSFHLFGYPMAFCERDTATYGSMALAGILFAFVRERLRPLPWRCYLAALVPLGIDGFTQLLGIRESSWVLRLLTGSIFGVATVWLAYPHIQRFAALVLIEGTGVESRQSSVRGSPDSGISALGPIERSSHENC